MNILDRIKFVCLDIICLPIWIISGMVPKNKNLWVFGAWEGRLYSDNTKYFFEYVNKSHKYIRCIWISKDRRIVEKINKLGYEAYSRYSFKGLWLTMHASAAFETEGSQDIPLYCALRKTKIFQLWHGIGVKKCKWLVNKHASKAKPWETHHELSYWMATSKFYIDVYMNLNLFKIPLTRDQFSITGSARNDTFVTKPKSSFIRKFQANHPNSKLILYMPTHRNFGECNEKIMSIETLKEVNEVLKRHDCYMLFKPHFHEMKNYIHVQSEMSNIILGLGDEFEDPYEYLHACDLLISDYSSVLYDFICSGNPIIYFPYDLEDYEKNDAGLEKHYYTIKLGPMCYSWHEVMKTTFELIENDTWKEQREQGRKFIHQFNDGKNCERIFYAVTEILNAD